MYYQRKVNSWRIIIAMIVLGAAICILPGCTRREQLVLETADKRETAEELEEAGQRQTEEEAEPEPQGQGQEEPMEQRKPQGQEESQVQITQTPSGEDTICVHVCGAVDRAGVYELPAGSRVFEAVEMAGGFTDEADESYVNQAQRLSDGDKLVIPTIQQAQDSREDADSGALQIGIVEQSLAGSLDGDDPGSGQEPGYAASLSASDGKININTASEAQLCEIPGIGAVRAAAIVSYRQEAGSFSSIEEIMNVSGIKEGTFAKIKDRIKVN